MYANPLYRNVSCSALLSGKTSFFRVLLLLVLLLKYSDVDGRIILRWIFGKWEGVGTGSSWLRIGTDGEHL